MTKEPKLEAAVRIVAEWTDYDQEIKRLQTRVQEGAEHTTKDQGTSTEQSEPHSQLSHVQTEPVSQLIFSSSCQTFTRSCEEQRRTGLCLKSLLHGDASLPAGGLLTDWPQTRAEQLKMFLLCYFYVRMGVKALVCQMFFYTCVSKWWECVVRRVITINCVCMFVCLFVFPVLHISVELSTDEDSGSGCGWSTKGGENLTAGSLWFCLVVKKTNILCGFLVFFGLSLKR